MLWSNCVLSLILLQIPASQDLPQQELVRAAWRDVLKLSVDIRQYTRYFDLTGIPATERIQFFKVLSGHVNGLSRNIRLVPPEYVKDSKGQLLRVSIFHYGWDQETWERLFDPLYSWKVLKSGGDVANWPGGIWPQSNQFYPANSFTYYPNKQVVVEPAPWLYKDKDSHAILNTILLETHSNTPIVRADFFLYQTAVEEGRKDAFGKALGYYEFLGIKDQKTYEKLVRFDSKLAEGLEHRRVVIWSDITQQPRRVEVTRSVLGDHWRSFDSIEAVDKHNPIRVLNDELQFDVTEQISPLPNGLPGFLLANNKGARQDKAPDNLVQGVRYRKKDPRLHVGIDCWACHLQGKREDMIKDIDAAPLVRLRSYDVHQQEILQGQYLRQLNPVVERSRIAFGNAIKEATGMESQEYGSAYLKYYTRYDEQRVFAATIARDFGINSKEVVDRFLAYDRISGGNLDPALTVVAAGGAIPILQYHELIPVIWTTLNQYNNKGYK